jgi:fluoride exporter
MTTRVLLLVGVGGMAGSLIRFLVSYFIQNKISSSFPFGTLTVNVLGCFIAGVIYALSEKSQISIEWRLLLLTGFCGGFTTFSAFSYESINLLKNGEILCLSLYTITSVVIGFSATYLGMLISKTL